ncbi:hypothetical protein ON010_g8674 [Phytophthora cinnamomi]|nr:hypothetical protein ON010_g8674 [Phytophthora cinnamomi]
MVGRPFYFKLGIDPQTSDAQLATAKVAIDAIPALKDVTCLGKSGCWSVVFGGTSKADVARLGTRGS